MITNTITITAFLSNGVQFSILNEAPPEVALAEYFCSDLHPPAKCLVLEVRTNEGDVVKLTISPDAIKVAMDNSNSEKIIG
jgi:hypothetical protein